jgi:hypothetical protein
MQKRGIFIVILVMLLLRLGAQEVISHKVLVPGASTWEGEGYSISYTVGEPVVTYLGQEEWEITQGFQQPSITFVPTRPKDGNGVDVYPNPARDFLKIVMFGDSVEEYTVTIFSIDGSIYFREDYSRNGSMMVETLDISSFKRGLYFVRVQTMSKKIERLFKIEKM